MKKDFHYSVIKILAIKAGFRESEAQKIAYASQYVDDATVYNPVRIFNPPDFIFGHARFDPEKSEFDPICTAHKLFGFMTGLDRDVQKKVYVSFHFIPRENLNHIEALKQKHYVTEANGALANSLMVTAVDELKDADRSRRAQKLIKLGLTIHSYADTWSHQGFSGIHSPYNDVNDLQCKSGGRWQSKSYWYRPDIGHAEVDDFPDVANIAWKYTYDETPNTAGAKLNRKNPEIFRDAAENIFRYLCDAGSTHNGEEVWDGFKEDLADCFAHPNKYDSDLKEGTFKTKFPQIVLSYDENLWINEAISGRRLDWFRFHVEAYNQRQLIVNM